MDIYDVLKQDHEKVRTLVKNLQTAGEKEAPAREKLLATLKQELETHTMFEEEVFYPAVAERKEARDVIADAIDEHDEAMTMLDELEDMVSDSTDWAEQLSMLSDTLDQHIDEEESEIFGMAQESIDQQRAVQMAKDYQRQKEQKAKESA